MYSLKRSALLATLLVAQMGCATKALWHAADPDRYVRVSADRVSEVELVQRGVDYRKGDKGDAYYVEKKPLQKSGDYAARILLTPLTVAWDATMGFVIALVTNLLPGMPEEPPDRACNDLEEDCTR